MKLFERIIDIQTGEEILREYTNEEIAEVEKAEAESLKLQAEENAKVIARLAILEKLGITEEEAKVLLG